MKWSQHYYYQTIFLSEELEVSTDSLNLLVDLGGEISACWVHQHVVGIKFQLAQALELAVHWSRITSLEHKYVHQNADTCTQAVDCPQFMSNYPTSDDQ